MKKLLLTSCCSAALALSSFGQGYINWGTISPTYCTFQTNTTQYSTLSELGNGASKSGGTTGYTVSGGANFYYALLYSTTATTTPTSVATLASSWSAVTLSGNSSVLEATNSNSAGKVTAMGVAGTQITLNAGTSYDVMLVGWSANLGTSWSTVLGELENWATAQKSITGTAFFGLTGVGSLTPTASGTGGVAFTATGGINSPNSQLYELAAVPEPGTMALAALGGASLLLFRRKK
jgi:hypothetical protein